jgi:hypothetical protein
MRIRTARGGVIVHFDPTRPTRYLSGDRVLLCSAYVSREPVLGRRYAVDAR